MTNEDPMVRYNREQQRRVQAYLKKDENDSNEVSQLIRECIDDHYEFLTGNTGHRNDAQN